MGNKNLVIVSHFNVIKFEKAYYQLAQRNSCFR